MFSKKFIKILGSLLMTAFLCILVMSNVYNAVNASDMQQTIDFNQKLTSSKSSILGVSDDTSSPFTWKVTNNLDSSTTDTATAPDDFSVNDPSNASTWWYIKDNVLHIRNHNLDMNTDGSRPTKDMSFSFMNGGGLTQVWPWTKYAQYIISVVIENSTTGTSIPGLFVNCINLHKITGLEGLIQKNNSGTSLFALFGGCTSLTNADLQALNFSQWDTSSVSLVNYMFAGCDSLTNIDLSSLDLSNVKMASYMFTEDSNLQSVALAPAMSQVSQCWEMFSHDSNLQKIDFHDFVMPVSGLKKNSSPFTGCSRLWQLSFGANAHIDTATSTYDQAGKNEPAVNYYNYLFSERDTSVVNYPLNSAYSPLAVYYVSWKEVGDAMVSKPGRPADPANADGGNTLIQGYSPSGSEYDLVDSVNSHAGQVNSFTNRPTWTYIWEPQWWNVDADGVLHIQHHQLSELTDTRAGSLINSGYLNLEWPWTEVRDSIKKIDIKNTEIDGGVANGLFSGLSHVTEIDGARKLLSDSSITDAGSMFSGCSSLKSLDLSGLSSSVDSQYSVKSARMFYNCPKLQTLDISNLNNVYDQSSINGGDMFGGDTSLWHLKTGKKVSISSIPAHSKGDAISDVLHPKYLAQAASSGWRELGASNNPFEPLRNDSSGKAIPAVSQKDMIASLNDGNSHDYVWDQDPGLITLTAPKQLDFDSHFLNINKPLTINNSSGQLSVIDTRYDRKARDKNQANDVFVSAQDPTDSPNKDNYNLAEHLFLGNEAISSDQNAVLTDSDLSIDTTDPTKVIYKRPLTDLKLQFPLGTYPKIGTYKTIVTYRWNNTLP